MFIYLKFISLLTVVLLFFCEIAFAQLPNKQEINLEEALEKAMANSHQIKMVKCEFLAAQADADKTKSLYLPKIEASMTGAVTNLPLQAFANRLQQGRIEQADFAPAAFNNPTAISNLQTQLMLQQPIINLGAKEMKNALIAKSKAVEQQGIRTKKALRYQLIQIYLQLQLAYAKIEVLLQAQKTAEANLKLTQDHVRAAYLQKSDALLAELRINEIKHQLLLAKNNIQNASDQLSFLMGEPLGTIFKPTEKLIEQEPTAILQEQLPTERSDIKAIKQQINAHKHLLDAAHKTRLPGINAFASYELNNNLDFKNAQHGYLIGIRASWVIFNGNKNKSAIQKATIELEKVQISLNQLSAQTKLDLEIAKRKMLEAQHKIDLSQKAITSSKEALRIKRNKYAEGLEKTTDILIAETKVAQMEMNYIEAIHQYQMAYAQLASILERD